MFLNSIKWGGINTFSQQGSVLLRISLLSFFLGPKALGDYALAATMFGAFSIFVELGLKQLYVAGQLDINEVSQEIVTSTTWWLNIICRILIVFIVFIVWFIVFLFNLDLKWLSMTLFLSFNIFISALSNPVFLMYERQGDFKNQAILTLSSELMAILFFLIFLYWHFGVWGLISSQLVAVAVFSIFSYLFFPFKKCFYFNREVAKVALNQGKNFIKISGATFTTYSFDKLIIGFFVSREALSFYYLAQKVCEIPAQFLTLVVNRALLPFLKKQYENKTHAQVFSFLISKLKILFILTLCFSFLIFLFNYFLNLKDWKYVVNLIPWVLIGVILRCMTQFLGSLFILNGRISTDADYKLQEAVIYILLIPIFSWFFGVYGILTIFIFIYIFTFYRRYLYIKGV